MSDPWHKHYHADILNSYGSLPVDLRGVAYTLLDLIYDRGGPLVESDAMLAARMMCSLRMWKAYKAKLLELGKFELTDDGRLTNSRAEKELKTRRKLAEFGATGGRAKAENAKKRKAFNDGDLAGLAKRQLAPRLAPDARDREEPIGSSSEDKSSGAEAPPDPLQEDKDIVWNVGRAILTKAGESDKAAGTALGTLVKKKGLAEAALVIAAMRANPPLDPPSYLWAIINGRKPTPAEEDPGAAPQLEVVIIDGKQVTRRIQKPRAA